ncbi:MAG: hypothetical protein K6U12_13890 [Armatimonadetes bacterium]|nr:hypothetical protein [Armatimonadota bacterium]CUU38336.1 hypothetical protein DCOP10_12551 [Armatimonadetes bacterium DC]
MTLAEIVVAVCEHFQGVESGWNGPRRVPDTPYRNMAHWINAFAWAHQLTGDSRFLERVAELASQLISAEARPHGYAIWMLPNHPMPGNGLIGQAWALEALLTASKVLNEPHYHAVATEIFHQHRFCAEQGLWHVLNPDGSIGRVHQTLNQQVWLAAMGAQLHEPEARAKVERFLEQLPGHIHLLPNGLLGMRIRSDREVRFTERARRLWREWKQRVRAKLNPDRVKPFFGYYETSVGYHAFAMYGMAMLKQGYPSHAVWNHPLIQSAVRYTFSEAHKKALRHNPFAMGYNPSGFEVPFILEAFGALSAEALRTESLWWVREQVKRHYNAQTCRFDRNTPDSATLTPRVYEAWRIPAPLWHEPL